MQNLNIIISQKVRTLVMLSVTGWERAVLERMVSGGEGSGRPARRWTLWA